MYSHSLGRVEGATYRENCIGLLHMFHVHLNLRVWGIWEGYITGCADKVRGRKMV